MPVSSKRRSAQKRSRSIRELSKESLSTVGKHDNLTECTSYEVESVEPTRQKIRRKDQHDYHNDSFQQQQHCVPQKEHRIKEAISSLPLDYSPQQRQQQQQAVSTFQILDVLPECMIGACFFEGYLDSMEIITSLSLVSKRMRQIGRETVKSLDLRKCTKLCPDDLKTFVNTFYNLTNLDFSYTRQFSDDHLIQLSKLTKTLRKLHLKGSKVTDKGLIRYLEQTNGQNYLEEIDISAISKLDSKQIGDESAIALAKYCPNLRLLNLGWCQRVSDVSTVSLSKLKHIEHLDLSLTSISSESCYNLSQLSTLKTLRLDATNICSRGLESLLTARKMTINSDSDDVTMKWNSHFHNLETLSLRFLDNLDLERLEMLIRLSCNHLKSIDLAHSLGTCFESSHRQAITKLAERGIAVKMAFY